MYELIAMGNKENTVAPVGFGNMEYFAAVDKGAEILYQYPYLTVVLRPVINRVKIMNEIKEEITKDKDPVDWENYVHANLLYDEGKAGASYYKMSPIAFTRLVLDVLDELWSINYAN